MPSRAVLPRILGALFYYSPDRPEVKALFDCLPVLDALYPWRDRGHIEQLCASWSLPDDCIDSLEVRKKPGGHWIIRDLAGLDLVGLASQ